MENLSNKNLAFFLDLGASLEEWNSIGILQREITIYNKLAKEFNHIYFFSYGNKRDLNFLNLLEKNITVITKKRDTKNLFYNLYYELTIPFRHYYILKQCSFLKSNQNFGTLAPTIAKIIHPKAKLIIRSGYIGSVFGKLSGYRIPTRLYLEFAERVSYFICNKALITTQESYDILVKKYPFVTKKLQILNNFIDTNSFRKLETDKKYDLIYVARLDSKQKNHINFLKSIRNSNLRLLLIGQGQEKDKIVSYCQMNNIQLTLIDKVANNELPTYYNQAIICAFPSLHEGHPKALLEAMSCELPVVGLNVPGVSNMLENNVTGYICHDIQEFKECILKILSNKETNSIGEMARKFVVENFSLEKIFNKELEIYKQL